MVVYLPQMPPPIRRGRQTIHKDLSSASRYGKLIPVLEADEQPSLTPGPALNKAKGKLQDFKQEDYVCYAGGDAVALALALLVLRDMGFRRVNLLRWERELQLDGTRSGQGFYVPVETPLY
jgi:hypothetical protein